MEWFLLAGLILVLLQAESNRRSHMSQVDDLRAGIAQVRVDLSEAVDRVMAKIAELGDVDPDLSADIAALGEIGASLDALVAAPVVEEPPVEEPPVE